ncbi:MAG TPA: hypothetical protein VFJ74_16975 [Gemmatimonadaceae bacterium]|nr:hypothetical protein [Gemmatimonadaceae bacterium]
MAARLGFAAATGLSLALAFSLGAAAVGGGAQAAASSSTGDGTYGGAPSGPVDAARSFGGGTAGSFAIGSTVRADLLALWQSSVVANEERVACIGGTRDRDGVVRITRVYALPVVSADSANAGAGPSLATCRPPAWFGTVHTHIITDPLGEPYTQFSSPDRDVITRWQRAWRSDGVFCLLYSDANAHCEVGGGQVAANVTYAASSESVDAAAAGAAAYASATAANRR